MISPTGNHAEQLTETPFPLFSLVPAYSPSGTRIAFMSSRNHPDLCRTDLFVMSADGHRETMIPTGLTSVDQLAWGIAPIG
ncbi:TolB family protein [Kribbella sp. NBC_00359]|uniref:TolB family protein n=1 Tax=Kribbella sp. NBC_00359 TaxID=2975966 RepID=UPI002E1E01DB